MKIKNRYRMPAPKLAAPTRTETELPVYGNLVVTPAKMMEMAEKGIPISAQNMSFDPSRDGEVNPSWDLPLDRLRGIDPATMWEESQVIKQRAKRAHDTDRRMYGDTKNDEK